MACTVSRPADQRLEHLRFALQPMLEVARQRVDRVVDCGTVRRQQPCRGSSAINARSASQVLREIAAAAPVDHHARPRGHQIAGERRAAGLVPERHVIGRMSGVCRTCSGSPPASTDRPSTSGSQRHRIPRVLVRPRILGERASGHARQPAPARPTRDRHGRASRARGPGALGEPPGETATAARCAGSPTPASMSVACDRPRRAGPIRGRCGCPARSSARVVGGNAQRIERHGRSNSITSDPSPDPVRSCTAAPAMTCEFRRYCPRKSSGSPRMTTPVTVARQCWPRACEYSPLT